MWIQKWKRQSKLISWNKKHSQGNVLKNFYYWNDKDIFRTMHYLWFLRSLTLKRKSRIFMSTVTVGGSQCNRWLYTTIIWLMGFSSCSNLFFVLFILFSYLLRVTIGIDTITIHQGPWNSTFQRWFLCLWIL